MSIAFPIHVENLQIGDYVLGSKSRVVEIQDDNEVIYFRCERNEPGEWEAGLDRGTVVSIVRT